MSGTIEREGWLTKEGGSIKSWKKRWCILRNGCLHYSKQKGTPDLGVINLSSAGTIQEAQAKKKYPNCFEIPTPERTFYISAKNTEDMQDWISKLNTAKNKIQGITQPSGGDSAPAASAPKEEKKAEGGSAVGLEDFDLLSVIGKGSFGKVMQVKHKATGKIYAMKVLNKKTIIERNELEHTRAEKSILQKLDHPFLVHLFYSFQTSEKLYFILDFINGGELFFHLQKDKKFTNDRVQFYCAEIVLGLEHLHTNGVLYRDLKPENLLLTADGHICMTDFGISKEGLQSDDARTATFCGTPEYLAPEVLEGNGYGKPVDWWSFGTLMYEMLTGLPPFYSQDVQQMYSKIMTAKLHIPASITPEAKDLLEKLLERDPDKRLSNPDEIKAHPYFSDIDWEKLYSKNITPPFIPPVKSDNDTSQVDPTFTSEAPTLTYAGDSNLSNTLQQNFSGFTYVADNNLDGDEE